MRKFTFEQKRFVSPIRKPYLFPGDLTVRTLTGPVTTGVTVLPSINVMNAAH